MIEQRPLQLFYGQPLTFSEKAHRYKWGGKHVPSVTTIIGRMAKPALIQWAADRAVDYICERAIGDPYGPQAVVNRHVLGEARRAHAMERDAAGDVGRIVHDFACAKLEGKGRKVELPDDPAVHRACAAFGEWWSSHKVIVHNVERMVFSRKHQYAGRFDGHVTINGRRAIIDFKTGNGVYDEAWIQMAGYDMALAEELADTDLDHWLIHLDKNRGVCTPYVRRYSERLNVFEGDIGRVAAIQAWEGLLRLDKAMRVLEKERKAQ